MKPENTKLPGVALLFGGFSAPRNVAISASLFRRLRSTHVPAFDKISPASRNRRQMVSLETGT